MGLTTQTLGQQLHEKYAAALAAKQAEQKKAERRINQPFVDMVKQLIDDLPARLKMVADKGIFTYDFELGEAYAKEIQEIQEKPIDAKHGAPPKNVQIENLLKTLYTNFANNSISPLRKSCARHQLKLKTAGFYNEGKKTKITIAIEWDTLPEPATADELTSDSAHSEANS